MGPALSFNQQNPQQINNSEFKNNSTLKIKKETIFIFDWDDTLMCTSFISFLVKNSCGLSNDEQKLAKNLGKEVSNLFKICSKFGKIVIMTNSSNRWVKETSVNYLKLEEKEFKNIKIISTRDKYFGSEIKKDKWKELATNEILYKFENKIKNIIFASDSKSDINLYKIIAEKYKNLNVTTIKFKSKPTSLEIIREIKFVYSNINEIIGAGKNFYLIKEEHNDEPNFNFHFGSLFKYILLN